IRCIRCIRCIRWLHRCHSLSGACWLGREDREEVAPASVLHPLVPTSLLAGPSGLVVAVLVLLWGRTAPQIAGWARLAGGAASARTTTSALLGGSRGAAGSRAAAAAPTAHGLAAAVAALLAAGDPLPLLGLLSAPARPCARTAGSGWGRRRR